MDNSPRLSGSEWQAWADKLLQRHHGPGEYQKVPDRDKGDAGIEGFTISTGCAYQAYGPVEPLSTQERYEKHRSKMSQDIRKFIENRVLLSSLFGNVKIHRWILLVPHYDSKEIVRHATKKTQEVLSEKLPYVADDFRVCIEDEVVFSVERDEFLHSRVGAINVYEDEITHQRIIEWVDANDDLVKAVEEKVSRVKRKNEERRSFRDQIIKVYLEGQNILEELRRYPLAYENIRRAKSQTERYLVLESLTSKGASIDILNGSLDKIRNTVLDQAPELARSTIEAIAWEAVADWIIRCPLDFSREN
jgi:hypothetical protein